MERHEKGDGMFAEVVLELPLEKKFDYLIPPHMISRLTIGVRVWVPFGQRRLPGYIVGIKDKSEFKSVKPLISLIDRSPLLSPFLIQLAEWIAWYYHCHLGRVLRSMLPSGVRQITPHKNELKYVRLIKPQIDMEILIRKAPKQARVLDILAGQGSAIKMMTLIRMAGTGAAAINALQKKGLVEIFTNRIDKDPYGMDTFQATMPFKLNDEQLSAYRIIKEMKSGVVLLQGVTSSGKTEVYLQVIAHVLSQGRGAIVIVPEISLTPQIVERFKARFKGQDVAVLHSRLSGGERYDQWQKIHEGKARIVIGVRSAIFAPVNNLGLIVVDEEHERTYKQEEEPRYNARDVAVARARIEGVPVVLGSATPSLESYYRAKRGDYKLVKLTRRIDNRPLAQVKIINLKDEIKKLQKLVTFSPLLLTKIRERLQKKQQIILFLNRRGFSPFVICRRCGFVFRCPHCTTAMTYHQLGRRLICHSCSHTEYIPESCPECNNPHIRFGGIGTQKVESQIAKFFPQARIRRMDTDVTTTKGSHRRILDEFGRGEIDILVGTQMIAKGLDFPNVTLVGVISADIALHLTDFRAGEHTFQLLTQVAGRSGRGSVLGEVIIQTLTPDHPAIKSASSQDYDAFAESEIAIRQELDYPPFEHFINITFRSRNPKKAELTARQYQGILEQSDIKVFGPIPAPISKLRGYYRWQVLLRAPRVADMLPLLKSLRKHKEVFIAVDIDPISML